MKNICVLVDFTETSRIAIQYGCFIADKACANLQVLHVVDGENKKDEAVIKKELEDFSGVKEICQSSYELLVEKGDFMELIPGLLTRYKSDLVVIATHGVKGIFHTMQGVEVLKLIQKIKLPSIILQGKTSPDFMNFKKILFPIASHSNFEVKIRQTIMLAKAFDSKVMLFILYPEKGELEEVLAVNLHKSEKMLKESGIQVEVVKETSKVYGIGYARQALEYADNNAIELFSIMALPSDDHSYFGNVERSEFILNKKGVPVLCCNE